MSSISYVPRINQLDATLLDSEIDKVFQNQIKEIFKFCPPGKVDKWLPEIKALLKILIWSFSLGCKSSTFGQQMLDLHYNNFNKKKSILFLALKLLPEYFKGRVIDNGMISSSNRLRRLKIYTSWIATVVHFLEFINLVSFLHRGTQPLLIERLLNISSVSTNPNRPRSIGYSYMTRELLWHGLMELFTLGIPMINYHYLKQRIRWLWTNRKQDSIKRSFPIMNESTICAYCKEKPILPTHAGCEHIFCYYCLQANFTAMKMLLCPECNTELHDCVMKNYVANLGPTATVENNNLL
ncbi:PREDICTED: peroxisome biogenesis factor 2 [Polistes dominula]|uniref:RING-type E3 ubiquitin transferase (cysteine targeting) n=1 Tax=Polistes dominula TaxID=743375 RepID=A0ABM1I3Z1_POLDO|nr:PREDICTED: peroxisome biogenesis factor 2 [Polistes dominula]